MTEKSKPYFESVKGVVNIDIADAVHGGPQIHALEAERVELNKIIDSLISANIAALAKLAKAQDLKDRPVWIVWGHRANLQGEWNLSIAAIATTQDRAKSYSKALREQEKDKISPYKVIVEKSRLDHLYGFEDLDVAYQLKKALSVTKGESDK